MKAIFINGGPRKNWNTHKLLDAAMGGAREAGAEAELVHLYDMSFKGCVSCFACKKIGSTTNGVCAIRDELRPILERCMDADALVLGAPIYLHDLPASARAFYERLIFPILCYKKDGAGKIMRVLPKEKRAALVLSGNITENQMDEYHYTETFTSMNRTIGDMLGSSELLFVNDTYQFDDYSKYDVTLFDPIHKAERRDKQFPTELKKAKELGHRLCE